MSSGANRVTDNQRGAGSSTRCGTATSTNARTKTRTWATPFRRPASIFRSAIYIRCMTRQNPPLTEPQYFILAALMDGPLHGYGIIKAAEQATDGRLRIAVGTLYGALERMERAGLVSAGHEEIVDGRARRYYRLTKDGAEALGREALRMQQAAAVVIGRWRDAGVAPA